MAAHARRLCNNIISIVAVTDRNWRWYIVRPQLQLILKVKPLSHSRHSLDCPSTLSTIIAVIDALGLFASFESAKRLSGLKTGIEVSLFVLPLE